MSDGGSFTTTGASLSISQAKMLTGSATRIKTVLGYEPAPIAAREVSGERSPDPPIGPHHAVGAGESTVSAGLFQRAATGWEESGPRRRLEE
jgi:hypothetical protein